jgi:hypothetical protein
MERWKDMDLTEVLSAICVEALRKPRRICQDTWEISQLQDHYLHTGPHEHRKNADIISMPQIGFKLSTQIFEKFKTFMP